MSGLELATAEVGPLERLHDAGSVLVTCPSRGGSCAYQHGPDRFDDAGLPSWLEFPFCCSCGVSLVVVGRRDYGGPDHGFRDLDAPADDEGVDLLP